MKLISYSHAGRASYGIVKGDGIIDAGRRLGPEHPTLRSALANMAALRGLAGEAADVKLSDVEYLPTVTDPARIICVGLNYKTHIAETGRDTPEHPVLFTRFIDSLVGHGQPMLRPKVSDKFDFEGELAFVIGKPGRHVAKDKALEHVAGYTCLNDGSIRDYQRHTHQFTPGKNFWRSGAMGPWLVTADELPDPAALTLITRLNGAVVQEAPTSDLLFGVAELIAYISQCWPLEVGDVVATGTTGGVGAARKPPLWMKPGDRIEVDISGVGVLSNPIAAE